jgi:hypothetical protein
MSTTIPTAKAEALRAQRDFFKSVDMDAAADHCEQAALSWESSADDANRAAEAAVARVRTLVDAWSDPDWYGRVAAAPFVRALRAALAEDKP